jgi:hypothetical protein
MRLEPFSYFWSCWNVRLRASATSVWLIRRRIGHPSSRFIGSLSRLMVYGNGLRETVRYFP